MDISSLNVFDAINNFAALRGFYKSHSKEALNWYKNEITKISGLNKLKVLGDNIEYQESKPSVGSFCMFFYSSKLYAENRLPYFDRFPLTLMLSGNSKYVSGLNFHYLDPRTRLILLKQIIEIQGSNFSETRKLDITYDIVKSATELYKPTYKTYLLSHIKSRVVVLPPDRTVPAVFLPVASWKGASQSRVWTESKAKL